MEGYKEQIKGLRPELLAAFQDLAHLSHRSIRNDDDEPSLVASALLERLQRLCQATCGAIFLTTFLIGDRSSDYPGSMAPSSLNGKLYRPLALRGIEEKDVDAFLTPFPTETLWTSRPTLYPAWLIWRLPLVLSFSPPQNEVMERSGQADGTDGTLPQAFLFWLG